LNIPLDSTFLFNPLLLHDHDQAAIMACTSVGLFDFVIVGGGTSGLVMANRLTENPLINVLVVEAGDNHINDPNVFTPLLYPALQGAPTDWNFTTVPQVCLCYEPFSHLVNDFFLALPG
jgi:hypothetical protein